MIRGALLVAAALAVAGAPARADAAATEMAGARRTAGAWIGIRVSLKCVSGGMLPQRGRARTRKASAECFRFAIRFARPPGRKGYPPCAAKRRIAGICASKPWNAWSPPPCTNCQAPPKYATASR